MSITFNGVSSDSLGLIVEYSPTYNIPSRKMSAFEVAGRNGDILYQQNAFQNVVQPYDCYIQGNGNLSTAIQNVIAWLISNTGYLRLEDSYTANQYRLAYCNNAAEVANALNKMGRCTIEFSCKPQRFLTSGESATAITSGDTLTNSTAYDAKPLIYVNTAQEGTIEIGGVSITCSAGEYYIDCDTQNAYFGTTNMNSYISASEFPVLSSGSNTITLTDIDTCTITPRWWVL